MDMNVRTGAGQAAAPATPSDSGDDRDKGGSGSGDVPMRAFADHPVAVRPCSLAASLEILGERWTLLAIREMAYGVHRFAKIAGFTGASRDLLADRLRKLEAAGVVERRQYSEHPPRYEYHLTQAGRELFPVTLALLEWGNKWAVDQPAVDFRHECGHTVQTYPACRHCGAEVTRANVTPIRPRRSTPQPGGE